MNIDASRVAYDDSKLGNPNTAEGVRQQKETFGNGMLPSQPAEWHTNGRFPSNVIGEIPEHQKYFANPTDTKPQSVAKNVQEWGTGALNIDASRVPYTQEDNTDGMKRATGSDENTFTNCNPEERTNKDKGRKPNTFLRKESSTEFGQGMMPPVVYEPNNAGRFPSNVIGEITEPYQKYFYHPKVSRKERHVGHETPPAMYGDTQGCYDKETGERFAVGLDARSNGIPTAAEMVEEMGGYFANADVNKKSMVYLPSAGLVYIHALKQEYAEWCKANNKSPNKGNNHPTVKPIALMSYLIKLVTPPGGIVLDPFNGSGSTGMAAVENGFKYVGCELDEHYCEISRKRIQAWLDKDLPPAIESTFKKLFK